MRWNSVLLALGLICLLASPVAAQQGDDAEELRRLIEGLEGRLQGIQSGKGADQRVTQLGTSRAREFEEPELELRIYDLSDLFALAPPYPATHTGDLGGQERPMFPTLQGQQLSGGAMGMGGMGGGGGMFNVRERPGKVPDVPQRPLGQMSAGSLTGGADSARTSMEDLIDAITATISPTEWDDVGGPASIAPLGNALLISASPQTHEQIDGLLKSFRERWGTLRTVSIRADWLWLTEGQLQSLLIVPGKEPPKPDEIPAFGLIDESAWQSHTEQLQQAPGEQPAGYRAVLTCYNGQTVHAASGGQSLAVTQMIPVNFGSPVVDPKAKSDSLVFYEPQVSIVQEGAALQVTPIATVSGKYVVLDVHSRVVQIREQDQVSRPVAEPKEGDRAALIREVQAAIDRLLLMNYRLATTLRVPVDRRMLVGGMTFESRPEPGQPDLYLFVKVAVQELRDDLAERKADAQPAVKPEAEPAAVPKRRPDRKKAGSGKPGGR